MKEREKQIWDFQTFPSFGDRYRHSVCDRYGQFSLAIGRTSVQFQQIAQTCTFLAKASIIVEDFVCKHKCHVPIVIIVCDIPMSPIVNSVTKAAHQLLTSIPKSTVINIINIDIIVKTLLPKQSSQIVDIFVILQQLYHYHCYQYHCYQYIIVKTL